MPTKLWKGSEFSKLSVVQLVTRLRSSPAKARSKHSARGDSSHTATSFYMTLALETGSVRAKRARKRFELRLYGGSGCVPPFCMTEEPQRSDRPSSYIQASPLAAEVNLRRFRRLSERRFWLFCLHCNVNPVAAHRLSIRLTSLDLVRRCLLENLRIDQRFNVVCELKAP